MTRAAIVILLALPVSAARAQDGGRPARPLDSVPTSIAQAERQGSAHPHFVATDSSVSQIEGLERPGSAERRCVVVGEDTEVRSGDFIAGHFGGYAARWAQGVGKLWWMPHRLSWPAPPPPLVVRAIRLDSVAEAMVFEKRSSARSLGPAPERHFYPTFFQLPTRGTWLLIATSGPYWGCFVYRLT